MKESYLSAFLLKMIRKAHVFTPIEKKEHCGILQNAICKKLLQEGWLSTAYHIDWVKEKNQSWLNLQQKKIEDFYLEKSSRPTVDVF